jgi:hypothetical protein
MGLFDFGKPKPVEKPRAVRVLKPCYCGHDKFHASPGIQGLSWCLKCGAMYAGPGWGQSDPRWVYEDA